MKTLQTPHQEENLPEETSAIRLSHPSDGVAVISLESSPLGVLRHAVKRGLKHTLNELETDESVRCLVITGVGKAFSVGSDIRDFSQEVGWLLENDYVEADLNQAIEDARFPVIAACNGFALGGGAVLALACDFRTASHSARFAFPEVSVGAFASGSGTQRLPRLVGRGRALDLLLTGRTIDATEALLYGLVEYVFEDDEMMEKTLALATQIAGMPAGAITATKRCVNVGLREGMPSGLLQEMALRVKTGRGKDALEGRTAFLEKRPPVFNRD
ncbi:MAG: enoyl-CoA hydratase/isomerase family protein [Anaerolineae bacterium]|nr:enoyl-CoA hydratase/isomerase family protein [Anaerolineae bacterium]